MVYSSATIGSCGWGRNLRWALLVIVLWRIAAAHCQSSYVEENLDLGVRSNPWTGHQIGRALLQERSNGTGGDLQNQTYTTLVARSRIDPLNHFKRYRGGYDIQNKHYWGSTVFTGVYGYAIAAVWLIAGVVFGIFLIVKYCCYRKKEEDHHELHSHQYYIWHFKVVLILTALAIITCSFVLAGNTRFHKRAKRIEKTIVGAADNATETIYTVTSAMKTMQEQLQPYDVTSYMRLNRTAEKLDMAAATIHDKVFSNKHALDIGLRTLYITVAVILSIILVLVISAVAVLLVHWRRVFILIIFICWILTVLSWFGFGLFYAIHTFADDTCIALREYQHNPYNTTLNSILPCGDLQAASDSLAEARQGVHVLISELNKNISMLHMAPIGTFKNIPYICDPFSGAPNYEYRPNDCSNNTIQVGDIPQILEVFKCSGNDTQECNKGGKYITESTYDEAAAYSTTIQNLVNIFPALETLTNCSFVHDAFTTILNKQCSPFKSSVNTVWISLLLLSIFMIVLVISWIVKAFQYGIKDFPKGSIIPHDTPANSPRIPQFHAKAFKQKHFSQTKSTSTLHMLEDSDMHMSSNSFRFQLDPT